MTFTFMSDGIPIVYYGQEQSFSGNADPVSHISHLLLFLIDFVTLNYPVESRTPVAFWIRQN